jgi:hypothetical protein
MYASQALSAKAQVRGIPVELLLLDVAAVKGTLRNVPDENEYRNATKQAYALGRLALSGLVVG